MHSPLPSLLPVGQPRGRGTADRWCGFVKYGWGGWSVRSCWWPRVVVEICPSVSPRRMNSDKPGRTQGHDRKLQLEAQRRDRVRPVGASLHPWGLSGCRYASERGEPTGRSATPSPRTHRPAHHAINDTREASQLSDLSPHRSALQPAQRRPGLKTRPSAKRWDRPAGLRPAPKGCLAPGQPERSERATRRKSSLLERPSPSPARSVHDGGSCQGSCRREGVNQAAFSAVF